MIVKAVAFACVAVSSYFATDAVTDRRAEPIANGCNNCSVNVGWSAGNPCNVSIITLDAVEPLCILDSTCLPLDYCWDLCVVTVPAPVGGSVTFGTSCSNSQWNPPYGPVGAPLIPGFQGAGRSFTTNGLDHPPSGGAYNCDDSHKGSAKVCTNPCPATPCTAPCDTSYSVKCVMCEQVPS